MTEATLEDREEEGYREEDPGVGLQDRLRRGSLQGRDYSKALLTWMPHGEDILDDDINFNIRGQVWNMKEVLEDSSAMMPCGLWVVFLKDEMQSKDQ